MFVLHRYICVILTFSLSGQVNAPSSREKRESNVFIFLGYLQKYQTRFVNLLKVYFRTGDGMSTTTVTAARILKGQLKGENGEETKLTMDKFPRVALSRVSQI